MIVFVVLFSKSAKHFVIQAVQSLLGDSTPVEIIDFYVDKLNLHIPWQSLLTEHTQVTLHNVEITVHPRSVSSMSNGEFTVKVLWLQFYPLE